MIEPEGLGRAVRNVSIVFLILAWVIVIARLAVRFRIRYIGADDYSMVGGLVCKEWYLSGSIGLIANPDNIKVLFTVVCIITIVMAYYGVGARDSRLTPILNKQSRKVRFPSATIYNNN